MTHEIEFTLKCSANVDAPTRAAAIRVLKQTINTLGFNMQLSGISVEECSIVSTEADIAAVVAELEGV